MSEIKTKRRFYLLKRLAAREASESTEPVWQAHQEEESATALPADFPSRAALVAVGYAAKEDIDGADEFELMRNTRISIREAQAVLAAIATI